MLEAEREAARQCCQSLLESSGNERSTIRGHSTLASWMLLFTVRVTSRTVVTGVHLS